MSHQTSIFDIIDQPYPASPGFKISGASEEAAEHMQKSGYGNLWTDRVKALFEIRDHWTAEEGITYWAMKLGLDARSVDKCLRPRFTECTLTTPPYIFRSNERRGESKIKAHVYKLAHHLVTA